MAQHGLAIFSHAQTAGRGQYGREWLAEQDSSILLSIIIDPGPLTLNQQFELSAAAAIATLNFFIKYAGTGVSLKWPNDLYWQDRKAGGILVESIVGGEWKWSVVGIGININQQTFPGNLKNPVSLRQITGKQYDVVELARELHNSFLKIVAGVKQNFKPVFERFNEYLYKRNQTVKFKIDSRNFDATVKGISSTGELVLHHGIESTYRLGEIEWIS